MSRNDGSRGDAQGHGVQGVQGCLPVKEADSQKERAIEFLSKSGTLWEVARELQACLAYCRKVSVAVVNLKAREQ